MKDKFWPVTDRLRPSDSYQGFGSPRPVLAKFIPRVEKTAFETKGPFNGCKQTRYLEIKTDGLWSAAVSSALTFWKQRFGPHCLPGKEKRTAKLVGSNAVKAGAFQCAPVPLLRISFWNLLRGLICSY